MDHNVFYAIVSSSVRYAVGNESTMRFKLATKNQFQLRANEVLENGSQKHGPDILLLSVFGLFQKVANDGTKGGLRIETEEHGFCFKKLFYPLDPPSFYSVKIGLFGFCQIVQKTYIGLHIADAATTSSPAFFSQDLCDVVFAQNGLDGSFS